MLKSYDIVDADRQANLNPTGGFSSKSQGLPPGEIQGLPGYGSLHDLRDPCVNNLPTITYYVIIDI